jgi:hypothetical protein
VSCAETASGTNKAATLPANVFPRNDLLFINKFYSMY